MNKKKPILLYFVIVLGIILCSLIISYILYSLVKMKGNYTFNLAMFTDKFFICSLLICLIGLFGTLIFASLKFKLFSNSKIIEKTDRVNSDLFDNQSFMSKSELEKNYGYYDITKLPEIEKKTGKSIYGIVVNTEFNKNTMYASFIKESHTASIGTTGTGKSTYQAGPILQINARTLTKPSFIVNDISGELYKGHAFWLQEQGYKVHIINLHTPREGLRYNPLSMIWDLFYQYQDSLLTPEINYEAIDRCSNYIEEISTIICPDPIHGDKNWAQGARGILAGCIWAMLEDSLTPELGFTKKMFTIAQISNIINRQRGELENFLFLRSESSKVFDCAGIIYKNRNEKGVDSYIGTLATALTLFKETGIQYLTSQTDIDFSKITDEPTAIFVVVPTEYQSRNLIAGLIYNQIYNMQVFTARKKENGKLERPLYFLLDEFGNLPKFDNFATWIATCRKMRIFFYIMLQSIKQLDIVYGKDSAKAILNQCQTTIYLGSTEPEDVDNMQKLLGTYTAKIRSESIDTSKSLTSFHGNNSLVKKNLVSASELKEIKEGEAFITQFRKKPLRANLISDFNKIAIEKHFFVKKQTSYPAADKNNYNINFYDLEYRNSFFIEDENSDSDEEETIQQKETDDILRTNNNNTENIIDLIRR